MLMMRIKSVASKDNLSDTPDISFQQALIIDVTKKPNVISLNVGRRDFSLSRKCFRGDAAEVNICWFQNLGKLAKPG